MLISEIINFLVWSISILSIWICSEFRALNVKFCPDLCALCVLCGESMNISYILICKKKARKPLASLQALILFTSQTSAPFPARDISKKVGPG
jgi:hypothetical protein